MKTLIDIRNRLITNGHHIDRVYVATSNKTLRKVFQIRETAEISEAFQNRKCKKFKRSEIILLLLLQEN